MPVLSPDEYRKAEQTFTEIFKTCNPFLSSEAVKDIKHYLDHGELEVAYESMVLSLIAEKVILAKAEKENLYSLATTLGLIDEGVLKANFWEEAEPFLRP